MVVAQRSAIARLEPSQIEAAAQMVARAFEDDPLMHWVMPDEQRRRSIAPRLYARSIEYAVRWGVAYTTKQLDGISAWLPPGCTKMSVGRLARVGLLTIPFRMGPRATWRFHRFNMLSARLHRQCTPMQHWYLMLLSVDPASQGEELGTALLEPVMSRARRERTPIYLDTTVHANISFFEKHGFTLCGQVGLPRGGPQVWAMINVDRGECARS